MTDSQLGEKQLGLEEDLGQQAIQYDATDLLEPIAKTIRDTNQNVFHRLHIQKET